MRGTQNEKDHGVSKLSDSNDKEQEQQSQAQRARARPTEGNNKLEDVDEDEEERVRARALGQRLGAEPVDLTDDGKSWYILKRRYKPSDESFQAQWDLHPEDYRPLVLFGKTVYENRWSQMWGASDYAYSGSVNEAIDYETNKDGMMVRDLVNEVNALVDGIYPDPSPYNGCLQNWYYPDHKIGLHSDDETSLRKGYPVFSLTWGGTRRFVLRKIGNRRELKEIYLQDGDLLVMGGTCQKTHKHELPKVRTTMDPETSERINWTIRAFVD